MHEGEKGETGETGGTAGSWTKETGEVGETGGVGRGQHPPRGPPGLPSCTDSSMDSSYDSSTVIYQGTDTSFKVGQLKPGRAYTFSVTAINAAGSSEPLCDHFTTNASVPLPPQVNKPL